MSKIVHKIGEVSKILKVKCVETPPHLICRDCTSYCALALGNCFSIACTPEERADGKSVHYELVKE